MRKFLNLITLVLMISLFYSKAAFADDPNLAMQPQGMGLPQVGADPTINKGNGECKICVSPAGRYDNTNPVSAGTGGTGSSGGATTGTGSGQQ